MLVDLKTEKLSSGLLDALITSQSCAVNSSPRPVHARLKHSDTASMVPNEAIERAGGYGSQDSKTIQDRVLMK